MHVTLARACDFWLLPNHMTYTHAYDFWRLLMHLTFDLCPRI